MKKAITVALPRSTPIGERLNEAGKQVRSWLQSLETPYDHSVHHLRSSGVERKGREVLYHYELRAEIDREPGGVEMAR